jgi:hypothetical protein
VATNRPESAEPSLPTPFAPPTPAEPPTSPVIGDRSGGSRQPPIFIGGPLGEGAEGRMDLGIPDPDQTPARLARQPDLSARIDEVREWVLEAFHEAKTARETGPNPRKLQWQRNYDAYWGREQTTGKQAWQADITLSTVADYVERWVAAMRDALGATPDWYSFLDPLQKNSDLESLAKRVMDAALAHCGTNQSGQHIPFPSVFASVLKSGAITKPALAVTWREGRLRIENVDARELFHDPTGNGLYRVRERPVDLHRLQKLKALTRTDGTPVYNPAAIDQCIGGLGADAEHTVEKERAAGHGAQATGRRRQVMVQEFLGTLLARDGSVIAENQLVVLVNETHVIRGPEPSPFWHGKDWIVSAPLLEVPFSVDGRSYVESFAALSALFTEFTNLLLDGIRMEAIPAYRGWPEALQDSQQLMDGVTPGKMFLADEDIDPNAPVIEKLDMGSLPSQAFQLWEAIMQLLREAAGQNELRLGRLADKSGVTATEIDKADAGSNVLVKHIAEGVEQNLLSPALELSWYTFLQHFDESSDAELLHELGPDLVRMLVVRREELRSQSMRLRATGISGLLALAQDARRLLAMLDTIGRSDLLTQQFLQDYSLGRTIATLLRAMRIDAMDLRKTPQELAAMQGAPGIGLPGPGATPPDGNPQLPVNLARASALRTTRGQAPGSGMPPGGGGRSGGGPLSGGSGGQG